MPTSLSNQIIRRRHLGFSIVEIMVGIVISMLAVLVIMQVYTVFEGRKRTATGGSDAQTNGSVALYTMDRDVRLAGYGINLPQALGCKVNALYNDKESHLSPSTKPFTLTPVEVTDGAGGLPDTIRLLYSGKGKFSLPARVITDHPAEADNFFLNTTVGIEPNDLMIAFEPGKDCTLLQVTDIPSGNVQILHSNGKSPWDPPGGLNIFPPGGYSTNAMLFNLGSLIIHSYSLDAGNNLQLANYLSASDTDEILTLFPNIVNLQAQYGFDTRAGIQPDARVDTWSDTVIDADKNGTTGDGGDVARIYAVRMAVVARSALMEKPKADGTCDFYTSTKPLFQKPAWSAGEIEVSKTPNGTAIADWECYRYKTFETMIPLRNLIWGK